MAITRVGATSVEAATVTIPAHNPGDLIIVFAFRDGSATNPTIGTGSPTAFTTITNTTDGTSCSVSAAWKRAATNAETSGTWTNTSGLIAVVYRGVLSTGTPIGTFQPSAGTTNTVTYAADTLTNSGVGGSSWFIAFAGHRSIDTTLESPPSGMFLTTNTVGATAEYAAFDTNEPGIGNWPSTNVSISGTASGWQTMVIEIKAEPTVLQNYMGAKCIDGNTGIISLGERIK